MGIARLVLAGLVVLALVVLIVIGVLSLVGVLSSDSEPTASPAPAPTSSSTASQQVPTVLIQCRRESCPTVFLKVAGGDVLLDREMAKDEQVQSFDAKIDVVLADSTSVRVETNGTVRPPGEPGKRQEFTVSRD